MPDFDAIIIGTGQAGPSLAFRLTGAGMKVAVVERHLVGGTCVNTGCTPAKALVASAYVARIARRAAEYGVVIGGDIGIDMRRVKARTDAIVAASQGPRPERRPWAPAFAGATTTGWELEFNFGQMLGRSEWTKRLTKSRHRSRRT